MKNFLMPPNKHTEIQQIDFSKRKSNSKKQQLQLQLQLQKSEPNRMQANDPKVMAPSKQP